jgi:hypothetical protein
MSDNLEINADLILVELTKEESSKKKTNIYVDETVWEDFKKTCGSIPPSNVLERLMKLFIQSKNPRK